MKMLTILAAMLLLSACAAPANKVGSVVIQNETGQFIKAKTRFLHDINLGSAYALRPNNEAEIAKYDIAPGTEKAVLVQLAEMQLDKAGCKISLDSARIEQLTRVEKPGMYIRITKDLFERCKKPKKPDLPNVFIRTMEG